MASHPYYFSQYVKMIRFMIYRIPQTFFFTNPDPKAKLKGIKHGHFKERMIKLGTNFGADNIKERCILPFDVSNINYNFQQ